MEKDASGMQTWFARSFANLPRLPSSSQAQSVLSTRAQGVSLDREQLGERSIHGLLGAKLMDRFVIAATAGTTSAVVALHVTQLLHTVNQQVCPLMANLVPIVGYMIQRQGARELRDGFLQQASTKVLGGTGWASKQGRFRCRGRG